MSLFKAYTRLAKLYGIEEELALSIYNILYSTSGVTRAYCLGYKPLNAPSLPPPDDIRFLKKTPRYARLIKRYLEILKSCTHLYSNISRSGPEAADAFYLYHLVDIASTRLSALTALGFKFERRMLDVIVMDLKEVEMSIYSMVTGVKWLTGPLIAAYDHSIVYKAIVDSLESEGYNIRVISESIANTETPRLREELLEWVKTRGSLLPSILSNTIKRKKVKELERVSENPETVGRRLVERLRRALGSHVLERIADIIVKRGSVMRTFTICEIAREAADHSGLYAYLLSSHRPINYIRTLWRPPKCPYPGFKWPLEEIFEEYIAGSIGWERVAEAIESYAKLSTGGEVKIPEDVIERYKNIVKTVALSFLKVGK